MEDPLKDIEWEEYYCEDCGLVTQHLKDSSTGEVKACANCAVQELKAKAYTDEEDIINWPKHYNTGNIQPIDVIEDWELDFRLANAVKYIARHQHKGKSKEDLQKAVWYINRYIDKELTKERSDG